MAIFVIALVIPPIGKATARRERSKCVDNLKQLNLGFSLLVNADSAPAIINEKPIFFREASRSASAPAAFEFSVRKRFSTASASAIYKFRFPSFRKLSSTQRYTPELYAGHNA